MQWVFSKPMWWLEGSTIFLNRSSLGHTSMESCRLAELKYAIFSGTDVRLKSYGFQRRSHQPLWANPKMVWTATFLGRTWTSSTLLESSQSRKLKYAVSAGWAKRSKNYSCFFLHENLEKFCSTELYHAPLEGLTIFLKHSFESRTPLESSWLVELKYAFFIERT